MLAALAIEIGGASIPGLLALEELRPARLCSVGGLIRAGRHHCGGFAEGDAPWGRASAVDPTALCALQTGLAPWEMVLPDVRLYSDKY